MQLLKYYLWLHGPTHTIFSLGLRETEKFENGDRKGRSMTKGRKERNDSANRKQLDKRKGKGGEGQKKNIKQ